MGSQKGILLNVGDIKKYSTELTYNDLMLLYKEYKIKNGNLPTTDDCREENNLPDANIVRRILKKESILYADFLYELGKRKNNRRNVCDYNTYVDRFIEISKNKGTPVTTIELNNNTYSLPSYEYFIKYCPDKTVSNYEDFIRWCGLEPIFNRFSKDDVVSILLDFQKKLDRPLSVNDITLDNVGFTLNILLKYFKNFNSFKNECGLELSPPSSKPMSFDECKKKLDKILHDISSKTDRRHIKWKDIETGCFSDTRIDHSTILKCFERKNMDAFSYIKSQGFMMNPSSFSFHYTFDDGERVLSSMEYDFSVFLKEECNYQYKKDYNRDIKYKDFLSFKENSNHNCDYEFIVDNDRFYIEIAGIITNKNNDWETKYYSSIQEQNYQKKMIFKKKLLEENNIKYLFLFPEDFLNNDYKTKFINFVNFKGGNVA